jgi:hypothetical protein
LKQFWDKPPDQTLQLTSSSRTGAPSFSKYALLKNKIDMKEENLQKLMKRGVMGMEITNVVNFPEDLASTKKIEYFILHLVHPTCWKNP